MKRTLLSLAIAFPLLAGCAAGLTKAGNWLESRDNAIAKGVGGFYKDLGASLAGAPPAKSESEQEKKKE